LIFKTVAEKTGAQIERDSDLSLSERLYTFSMLFWSSGESCRDASESEMLMELCSSWIRSGRQNLL